MKNKYTIFFVLFVNFLYSALILNLLWNWFVTPLGFVKINLFWAIGLLLLAFIFDNYLNIKNNEKINLNIKMSFYIKTFVLLIGFLCSFLKA